MSISEMTRGQKTGSEISSRVTSNGMCSTLTMIRQWSRALETTKMDLKIVQTDPTPFFPQKLMENARQLSTVNHVHGCINYFYKDNVNDDLFEINIHDLYLFPNYEEVRKRMIGRGQSNPSAQNNEQYYAGPIITGLRKTDKLNCMPYDFYHGNLYNAVMQSNAIVIVGYSFGDLYVNNLINRMHAI